MSSNGNAPAANRAWAICSVAELLAIGADTLLGRLVAGSAERGFDASESQIRSWRAEYASLHSAFERLSVTRPDCLDWHLLFEYSIPRRGSRIDIVILGGVSIAVLEFKVNSSTFDRAAVWQTEDYALDLRDFHSASRDRAIIPILIATAFSGECVLREGEDTLVACTGDGGLPSVLMNLEISASQIDPIEWDRSQYAPTPGIVAATCDLFESHSVASLSHHCASNLTGTVARLASLVAEARAASRKLICFVTGVPGAGKTLAGLAAASMLEGSESNSARAAYMSGNGPLVIVLREALARDGKARFGGMAKARRLAKTLIQNVHEFTREYGHINGNLAPRENVIVFDEAQRAWSQDKLEKRYPGIGRSEPALMLEILARHPGWCVLIALVGSGQEIHDGEAGLEEWARAIDASDTPWSVAASNDGFSGIAPTLGTRIFTSEAIASGRAREEPLCHLDVSVRSPRARRISDWVDAFLNCDFERAKRASSHLRGFRLGLTRDLDEARDWLRDAARNEMRPGLLASSGALRLRAEGLEVSPDFLNTYPIERWFLDGPDDFRSSHSLEVALSEFKVQGLEVDFAGVCWGGDLVLAPPAPGWTARRLRGTTWQRIQQDAHRTYVLNKYRVLLTRAREGMIIYVPRGSCGDPTRCTAEFDAVASLIARCMGV